MNDDAGFCLTLRQGFSLQPLWFARKAICTAAAKAGHPKGRWSGNDMSRERGEESVVLRLVRQPVMTFTAAVATFGRHGSARRCRRKRTQLVIFFGP